MQTFFVERYLPAGPDVGGDGSDRLRAAAERDRAAADGMTSAGAPVRHLQTIYVPGDETCFGLFAADSLDVVAEANRRAGLEFTRIVAAVLLESDQGAIT